ncbi:phage portal protein [Paraburkholderia pallida]|uniref:Phage portal protein n=1 Tax=Paraburkholderia pallida TaxID=2547399 RepID=A0A4P7CQS1_9BURK|nr:phage portal protein [Paraburkholderia pallida]QBQ98175.1 phage portal protein [Paraburkholderia pallida]
MRETFLDRAISWVSPSAGVQRMRARAALESGRVAARAFDGASKNLRGLNWRTPGTSGNAELVPALAALRNRSRDLVRNNGYIKHALRVWGANLVGTGIVAKFDNKRVQTAWTAWIDQCDADGLLNFYGLQLMVARAMKESGECLVRFRVRRLDDGLDVPLQLQVLEADYLDSSRMGLIDGGFCVAGVQFDRIGRRVGYWLFDQHPGELIQVTTRIQSRFVPASEVLHLFDPTTRPNTVRGLPEFAVSIWRARDLDEYHEAERVRKKIEACFAGFIIGSAESGPVGSPVSASVTGSTRVQVEQLEPGTLSYLNPDEDIKFATPTSNGDFEPYNRAELRAIAAGSDVTYEQLTGDFSQVNFTSGRMGKMEFKRILEQQQWLIFIPMFCNAVANRFVQTGYLAGRFAKPVAPRDWTAPRIEMVDPLRETKAMVEQINEGLISRAEAQRQIGQDPATMNKEIGEDTFVPKVPAAQANTADGSASDTSGASAEEPPDKSVPKD